MGRLLDEDIVIDALIGISGSKSIEELTEECEVYQSDNRCYSGGVYGAIRAINTLTSVQPYPQWIPVSERLPEDYVDVLVWFEYFRYGDYNCMYATHGIGNYSKEYNSWTINHETGWKDLHVFAWMPLPEAYKPNK